MKRLYIFTVIVSMSVFNMNAQFVDDMESYVDGQPISNSWWKYSDCGGGPGCALMSSSDFAQSGSLSGLVPGDFTTDAALDLGNKIFAFWCLKFSMYIPSGKEAYWNLLDCMPIPSCPGAVSQFYFNLNNSSPGQGYLDMYTTDPNDDVSFNFPHDQWFDVIINVDILSGVGLATWELGIDGQVVIPAGTPYTDGGGVIPTSLGGIEFFSLSPLSQYYLDDIDYLSPISGNGCTFLGTGDLNLSSITLTPNPVSEKLTISSSEIISSVAVYSVQGQKLYSITGNWLTLTVDMTEFLSGIYFVKVYVGNSVETIKIIR